MCHAFVYYNECFLCEARHYLYTSVPELCVEVRDLRDHAEDDTLPCPKGVEEINRVSGYIRGCRNCDWGKKLERGG